ncbi:MAG: hypothetical protein U0271_41630 [Polyangiaceae bacterium]
MSDEQDSNEQKPQKTRRIVRSASTAERTGPASEGAPASASPTTGEGAAPTGARKWDVRAVRPAPAQGDRPARPARPGGSRPDRPGRPPRGPRPGGPRPQGDARPATEGAPEQTAEGAQPRDDHGPRRPRRFEEDDVRRPGMPSGRVSPLEPRRGPMDRASPEFIDKWLTMPPRKPGEGPPPKRDKKGRDERRKPEGKGAAAPTAHAKPAVAPAPAPAHPPAKLPTLHETILVGLPKVAVEAREKQANKPKTAREALVQKTHQPQPAPKAKAAHETPELVLEPEWLTADAERAAEVLRLAGGAAEALIDTWLRSQNLEAIAAAASDETLSGAARKAARRAASVLRSRGVALPEVKASQPAALSAVEEEIVEANFNAPDGRGAWSATISKRRGGERAHIAEVIVREGVGVTNAFVGWMSRSQIKEAHQNLAKSSGVAPTPVDPNWIRWRVKTALEDNAKSGQLVPLQLERCKDLLEPAPESQPPHPTAELEAAIGDGENTAPASLFAEPELRSWLPDPRAIDEMIRKVGARLTPEEGSDSAKVEATIAEEIKAAVDRYFTPEARAKLSLRIRDVALCVRARSGDDRAKELLRAARAIESAGLITSPPSELEFLRVFFQRGLSYLAQQGGGSVRLPTSAG